MNIELLPGGQLAVLITLAFGLTYIITGSAIGFVVRALWCGVLFRHRYLRKTFWPLVRCPPCNSFWSGAAVGVLFGPWDPFTVLQVGISSCGVTALIQAILGGDGIAANEDEKDLLLGV